MFLVSLLYSDYAGWSRSWNGR